VRAPSRSDERLLLHALTALAGALSLVLAPDLLAADEEDESPAAAAAGEAQACKYPVEVLWHKEPEEGPWRMGVSVLNQNQQQVAGLKEKHFQVLIDGEPISVEGEAASQFRIRQSKRAFAEQTPDNGDPTKESGTGVDPVNYDFYISVDLTASMGQSLQIEGQSQARTRLSWVANGLAELFKSNALFDAKDLVYISGFTSRLETGFMAGSTNDR